MPKEKTAEQIATEAFEILNKDQRSQIFGGRIDEVGGRSTELEQLYFSISHAVREFYPINRVPADVVSALTDLHAQLKQAEDTFAEIVMCLVRDVKGEQ